MAFKGKNIATIHKYHSGNTSGRAILKGFNRCDCLQRKRINMAREYWLSIVVMQAELLVTFQN